MTSSERHLKPGQPRWDYNIQKYKDSRDVFCEDNLFSILFLSCGRHSITKRCLLSSLDAISKYTGEVEWVFLECGQDEDNYKLFHELKLERKVIIRQKNFGINNNLNQGWIISRGEFIFILENDWELRANIEFLSIVKDIFHEKGDIGIVQLRAASDKKENWGWGKAEYWPWSCNQQELDRKNIRLWHDETKNHYKYLIANHPNAWSNNPCIIRKQIYRECGPLEEAEISTDPRHGETSMQERTSKLGFVAAHIGELYYHCGQIPTRAT